MFAAAWGSKGDAQGQFDDPAGIALAAIQELHQRNELLSEQNKDMKTALGELRRLVESIAGDKK